MYSKYSTTYNDYIKVVGVSDIIESRCNNIADQHNVPQENRFGHYREVVERPKIADAVIIATPDDCHYEPCINALEMGYDVLWRNRLPLQKRSVARFLRLLKSTDALLPSATFSDMLHILLPLRLWWTLARSARL